MGVSSTLLNAVLDVGKACVKAWKEKKELDEMIRKAIIDLRIQLEKIPRLTSPLKKRKYLDETIEKSEKLRSLIGTSEDDVEKAISKLCVIIEEKAGSLSLEVLSTIRPIKWQLLRKEFKRVAKELENVSFG